MGGHPNQRGTPEEEYGFEWPIDLGEWAGFNVRAEWRKGEREGSVSEILWLRLPMVGPISVPFDGAHAWRLVRREPLTVTPSVKVMFGDGVDRVHGHVTEGRWVPACPAPDGGF